MLTEHEEQWRQQNIDMNFEMYISLGKYLHTMNEADAFPMRTICRAIAVPQSKTYRDGKEEEVCL